MVKKKLVKPTVSSPKIVDTQFVELEFSEINEHIRSTSQLLVGWYTFYITASVAGVIAILDKVHLHEIKTNDDKVVIMGFFFSILYAFSNFISMVLVSKAKRFFIGRYKRLDYLLSGLNQNREHIMHMPAPLGKFTGLCNLMNISLTPMLIAWIVVLIFSLIFLSGNMEDGRILITPYHK